MSLGDASPAVLIRDLTVVRGRRRVLPQLSLEIPARQVIGLLGPSGSGKSTLMRAIVGVQVIESGTVTVLGHAAGSRALRDQVGYVAQSLSVYQDLTVRENIAYFGRAVGLTGRDLRKAVDATVSEVDLEDHAGALVRNLSGGQESRVSLACALVGRPSLLVLDEPTVGLDPILRRDLWDHFHDLVDQGCSLIVSSHVMDEATRCDRLILLRDGRVLADLTPAELLERTGEADADAAFLALVEATGRAADGEVNR
ncbi:ABC transporter ATP-binding protein [Intrasporangium sp.]|uniref:ABC transporter ATP-binding protein n=1 Tax=Intrasporangium sp. TaxID=1925024 RepID=UPI003365A9D6